MNAESMYQFALGVIEAEENEQALGVNRPKQEVWKARAIREYVELAVAIARRQGFEAAREPETEYLPAYVADEKTYAVLDGHFKYANFEHYERLLKESK